MQANALFPHDKFKKCSMEDCETHCCISLHYLNILYQSLMQWLFTT